MAFCRRCGSSFNDTTNHVYICANGHTIYANASPTVGIFFVTDDNQVLVSRRGIEPFKGQLDSFGGFLDGAESFEQAAARELQEELSLSLTDYEPLQYLCSHQGAYPLAGEVIPITSVFFWSRLTTSRPLQPLDDVAEIVSVPLFEFKSDEVGEDIRAGIARLQQIISQQSTITV